MAAPAETIEGFRLSRQQAAAWRPGGQTGAVECAIELTGPLDEARLRTALTALLAQHEVLRTTFRKLPAMTLPLQVIAPAMQPDWRSATDFAAPFDLATGPLVRANLERRGPGSALLRLRLSALIADETTAALLAGALAENYRENSTPVEADVQYVQFAEWQSATADEDDAGRAYWQERYIDLPAPSDPAGPGATVVSAPVAAQEVPVLLTAFAAVLARFTGTERTVVHTAFDGRRFDELTNALGPYTNHLPVQLDTAPREPFATVRARCERELTEHEAWQDAAPIGEHRARYAFSHVELPTESVVDTTRFAVQSVGPGTTQEHLRLAAHRTGAHITVTLSSATLAEAELTSLLGAYLALLADAGAHPGTPVGELALLTAEKADDILTRFNTTARTWPEDAATVVDLIAAQTTRTPDAIAVTSPDGTLTYAELHRHAEALAAHLRASGVRTGDPVAVCLPASLPALVGLLGILRAGAVFVPVDPADPPARRAAMLADLGASVVLTERELDPSGWLAGPVDAEPTGADTAYVIHTSGSTGTPKGVAVSHASLANYLRWANADVVGDLPLPAITRLTFDASLKQLLGPLIRGGRVWLLPPDTATDPAALYAQLCRSGGPIGVNCVPSLWDALLTVVESTSDSPLPGRLRRVLLGGEALPETLLARTASALPDTEVWNLYGPTEGTANATAGRVRPDAPITIGTPVANTQVFLLDENLRPVPAGARGGMYLGGAGVAQGYVGRPRETADRFRPNPFGAPGSRIYRTGDLGRYQRDGGIEYLGRDDLQVKIRGFRIELAGVEAVLSRAPGVRAAAVTVRDGGVPQLVGFVVPAGAFAIERVREHLMAHLPDYAVPTDLSTIDALPRTTTGKLDRAALADLRAAAPAGPDAALAPRTLVEEQLAAIWARLLGDPDIRAQHNFFERGGHSLLVIQLISRVRDEFGVELEPQSVFAAPTLREFAELVEAALAGPAPATAPRPHRIPRTGRLPLSYGQHRLLILELLEPGNPRYNVVAARKLVGTVDPDAVRAALARVVDRHEVLRTGFALREGEPNLTIAEHVDLPLDLLDLRDVPQNERTATVRRLTGERMRQPFDLAEAPLLRAALLRTADDEALLLLVVHHIVCDGWAKAVLFNEFAAHYGAALTGAPLELAEPEIQYVDFAAWERATVSGETAQRQLAYWRTQLAGVQPLNLPTDRPRPAEPAHVGATVRATLSEEHTAALRAMSTRHDATLFMTLLATFATLLARYSGQDDVVIGTPVANRRSTELEELIGFFVNTVALRTDLSGDPSFAELLRRTRQTALAAYQHQTLPFDKLVEELQLPRTRSVPPVFQAMFQFVPAAPREVPVGGGSVLRKTDLEPGTALVDLTLSVRDEPDGLELYLNHDVALFDTATAERMLGDLVALLHGVLDAPERPVRAIALPVEPDPVRQVDSPDRERCLHELVEQQARRLPDAPALRWAGGSLTYRELDQRANQVAHRLVRAGVGPERLVAVCARRSPELVVALLGVLKAGGAFVPIAPDDPRPRVRELLHDIAPVVVLADDHTRPLIPADTAPVLALTWPGEPADPVRATVERDGAAYMIYTSGSTGRPKGAINTHGAVANEFAALRELTGLTERDVVLCKTTYTFDVSMWEYVWPLTVGASVVVAEHDGQLDPVYLARTIAEHQVSTVQFVPTMLRAFLDTRPAGLGALRQVLCIGEALPADLVGRFRAELPGVDLHNLYGPAEAALHVTQWTCTGTERTIPIGTAIGNVGAYVLDERLNPVPRGVVGQLYLGGRCLARGYLNAPGKTADRFLPNPFADEPGSRLYATGDLAAIRADGVLEFHGRVDHQVKIRGQRVEPGETEAALLDLAEIREALVVTRADANGDPALVAYVSGTADSTAVLASLRSRLPSQLVPTAVVVLPDLPRSANGKLDRRALPEVVPAEFSARTEHVAPRDELERRVARLWRAVLRCGPVGAHDHFIALGGHSLLMIQLTTRLRAELGVELPPLSLLAAPTLAEFTDLVRAAGPSESLSYEVGDEPVLSHAQQRMWIAHQLEPDSPVYHVIASRRITGDVSGLPAAIARVLDRHEVLRTGFPAVRRLPTVEVHAQVEVPLAELDLRAAPDQETALGDAVRSLAARPFDLARPPLLRALLTRLSEQDYVLSFVVHHIVFDAWSEEILFAELDGAGEPLTHQYLDFARQQRAREHSEQLAYWSGKLADLPVLPLPSDRPEPRTPTHRGRRITATVDPRPLRGVATRADATLFMTVLAGFGLALAEFTGSTDIPIATPATQRDRAEWQQLIGCFINTLILRLDLTGEPTLAEATSRARTVLREAFDNAAVPFDRLVEHLRPTRDPGRSPLFRVMFLFAGRDESSRVDIDGGTAVTDLRLLAIEDEDALRLVLTYDQDLFDEPTARGLLDLITGLLRQPAPVAPAFTPVPALIDRQVDDKVAVSCLGEQLTYRQLRERSNRLARLLREYGAGPGTLVAVHLDRSVELVVALLAVLRTGAAYLPLDPAYPSERTRFILADAKPAVLVTDSRLPDPSGSTLPRIELDRTDLSAVPATPHQDVRLDPVLPAYVIYTSGSTGTPKGVLVTHGNLAASTEARLRGYPDPVGAFLLVSSVAFDSSVAGLFWTLASGGHLVVSPPGADRDIKQLAGLVAEHQVTHVLGVPSWYAALLDLAETRQLASLRVAIVAGEPVPATVPARHFATVPNARLYNEYGLTECGVWSTVHECLPGEGHPVPAGTPILGTECHVLDGELYIGGAGIALGYLNRPALTASRFGPDPFSGRPGARLYRTGDRARYRADGAIELLGRVDNQVKLRGFRVELEDVEQALTADPSVTEAAVVLRTDEAGEALLGAFVIAEDDLDGLRDRLRERLPDYLVPSRFVLVADLPRSANGKLDRAALPDLPAENAYEAPRDELEAGLVLIWQELFGLARVGVHDNFFELGGHSLRALYLLSMVEDNYGVELPLRSLFEAPTVAEFASVVERALGDLLDEGGTDAAPA